MRVVAEYSFNKGASVVKDKYAQLYSELLSAIERIDSSRYRTKISEEKTMAGKALFSPLELNKAFKELLHPMGWMSHKEYCTYSHNYYLNGYQPVEQRNKPKPFREMDFVKDKLGVEVQFGKYAFMVYNVCAKMTIFRNLGIIDAGVEIIPVKSFADGMSTGVSYFEQFTWDLDARGVGSIDIPVLILGIDY